MLGEKDIRQQSGHVRAGDKLALFIQKHATVGIGVPDCRKVEVATADQFFRFRSIGGLHGIGRALGKRAVRGEVQFG